MFRATSEDDQYYSAKSSGDEDKSTNTSNASNDSGSNNDDKLSTIVEMDIMDSEIKLNPKISFKELEPMRRRVRRRSYSSDCTQSAPHSNKSSPEHALSFSTTSESSEDIRNNRWTTDNIKMIKKISYEAMYYGWCYKYLSDQAGKRNRILKAAIAIISGILTALATTKFVDNNTTFKIIETILTVIMSILTYISVNWKLNEKQSDMISLCIECNNIKTECITMINVKNKSRPEFSDFIKDKIGKLDILKSKIEIPDNIDKKYKRIY